MGTIIHGIKAEAQGNNKALVFETENRKTGSIVFNGDGFVIEGITFQDGVISGADLDVSADLGSAPTPVTTRTNNPIVGTNLPNANIDALDAAIGADNTPAVRTNSPTVANSTINAKVQALDTAIGADATPAARTTGPIAVTNTVNANLDALDTAIGFEGQMSGTPHVVTFPTTVFQALDKLDTYKSVQTVKKTIGGVGVAGCDFNFATAENQNEQAIDLGELIPAKARLVDIFTFTNNTFTGAVTLAADIGTTSGGDDLIASSGILTANDIIAAANAGAFILTPAATAKHVYLNATPGANWNLVTAGKVSVYITYINVTNI